MSGNGGGDFVGRFIVQVDQLARDRIDQVQRQLAAGGRFQCSQCGLWQGDEGGSLLPSQPCVGCIRAMLQREP